MPTKVAVIGAGALGLMAMKNLKEDGFHVTGFESRPYIGGLWKDSHDSSISVHATTTFNSSKYRSAISDFPFPEDTDDFPTAVQMHNYLTSYGDHFGISELVRLRCKVVDLRRKDSRWMLEVHTLHSEVNEKDVEVTTEYFDKVVVATGSFFKPKTPIFEGSDVFSGDKIHSIDYHGPAAYKDKTVLLIGMHASAQDVAVSLAGTAKKVFMSHRGGMLLLPRYTDRGAVYDSQGGVRLIMIQTFMSQYLPRIWHWIFDKLVNAMSAKAFKTRPEWGLLPAPSLAVSTPLIGDKLYALLSSGFATPVVGVERMTGPKSVWLCNGDELNDIDAIIYCTGYDFAIPCISQNSPYQPYPPPLGIGHPPKLYRNTFPLDEDPEIRNSLAFMGQVGITFPGFVVYEIMAQCISQIWLGNSYLPPFTEMKKWHHENLCWRKNMTETYGISSTFYPVTVRYADHMRWINKTAGTGIFEHFDWAWFNRKSWGLWWRDRSLYRLCMDGLLSPAVFRLFDCGKRKSWSNARTQIFLDNEAVKIQTEKRFAAKRTECARHNGKQE